MKIWALTFCLSIILGLWIVMKAQSDLIDIFHYQDFLLDNDLNVKI